MIFSRLLGTTYFASGHNLRARSKGQSMAEVAIALPLLLMLVSGLLDLGRLYYAYVGLEDAAAEAALFLAVSPNCANPSDGANCADPNNALYRAHLAGGPTGFLDFSTISTSVTSVDDEPVPNGIRDIGDTITVTMDYPFELLTPIMPKITGVNPLMLEATAAQVIVQNPND